SIHRPFPSLASAWDASARSRRSPAPSFVVAQTGSFEGHEVVAGPIAERFEEGVQAPAEGRHGVLDAGRDLFEVLAVHDAIPLEIAKLLREHALRDSGDPPLQLDE